MDSISNMMMKLIDRCDICINNKVISKELLMRTLASFISMTIEKEKHNVGIILHTGSICFDAIMLSYAALSNILYNNTDTDTLVSTFLPGDIVLYKKQRYIFCGFIDGKSNELSEAKTVDEGDCILLQQNDKSYMSIPRNLWGNLAPYWGNSQRLDGRGLRRDNGKRREFFENVLDMHGAEIPSTIDTSTVVVMSKEDSADLIKGLSFKYGDKTIRYTELVTASYYTEKDEYQYGHNPAKTEPVIKVTGKVSVARRLLLRKDMNRNIGLIVLGDSSLRTGQTELPELIERNSIQYVYLCTHIDSDSGRILLNKYPDAHVFACTKDFLLENSKGIAQKNQYTEQLDKQIDAVIEHEVCMLKQGTLVGNEDYRSFKRSMRVIKNAEFDSEKKDDFLIQAFSLMNLFITAPFTIKQLENSIANGNITNVKLPIERIQMLKETVQELPTYLAEHAENVVKILNKAYNETREKNIKRDALDEIININKNNKLCVVVPKQYYANLLKSMYPLAFKTDFVTANKFNNEKIYDIIICVGNFSGKRFDIFKCKAAEKINVLLYDEEQHQYRKKLKLEAQTEHNMNIRSAIEVQDEDYNEMVEFSNDEIADELDLIDSEINEIIDNAIIRTAYNYTAETNRGGLTDIVAIARFDSEEVAFFTRNFKAYILAEDGSSVQETEVSKLADGDILIFTRSTAKTRDIVDELLREMVNNKRISADLIEAYEKSKKWKKILIDYMNANGLDEKTLAQRMIKSGASVKEMTIRTWLDEDSHTVGPRKIESLENIARVTGNQELMDHADVYFESCRETRSVRRKILDAIGNAILRKATGIEVNDDSVISTVSEKLDELSVILQIEHISFVEKTIPTYMTNKPVYIEN